MRDYPGMTRDQIPYSRPYLPRGFAFNPSSLGLRPNFEGKWSPYWLMRVGDM